jgi:hypothetical protein
VHAGLPPCGHTLAQADPGMTEIGRLFLVASGVDNRHMALLKLLGTEADLRATAQFVASTDLRILCCRRTLRRRRALNQSLYPKKCRALFPPQCYIQAIDSLKYSVIKDFRKIEC